MSTPTLYVAGPMSGNHPAFTAVAHALGMQAMPVRHWLANGGASCPA